MGLFDMSPRGRCRPAVVNAPETATITLLVSNVTRMAPCVVSAHAVATVLVAGDYHTARYQWEVDGPVGWTSPTCLDPRLGLQEGDTISLDTDCEGFNFAFPADVAGDYTLRVTVTDEDGGTYTAEEVVTVAADTRTALYVSASGNDTTGDGSIGTPWRQPSKAWDYIVANGKADFSVLLEKGGTYTGFGNDAGGDGDCSNIYVGTYGSGADPIVKWSTADYPTGSLFVLAGSEQIVVQGINFRGNDADNIHGTCIVISNECLNVGFIGVTFGGASSVDYPSVCIQTAATNTRNTVPSYQSQGLVFFNCSGHSSAYFLYCDANDTQGVVSDTGFTPTTTEFECSPTALSTTDDVYNGMEIILGGGLGRNQRRTVSDYIGNTGAGKCKFVLAAALKGAPPNAANLWIASIVDVGDSDVFLFGCHGYATSGIGTEARTRLINVTRMTAVGSVMDGSTNAVLPKSGWRLMVDYCYLYRSAELNGGVQIGVDVGAGGMGPHTYMVMDRCYFACLDEISKGPFGFTYCSKVMVKACVGKGNMTSGAGGNNISDFSSEYNASGVDVRIVHCSLFMNRWAEGILIAAGQGLAADRTYWPAAFFTYENNLQLHASTTTFTEDMLRDIYLREDGAASSSFFSCKGNVFRPDPGSYGGGLVFSKPPNNQMALTDWNLESFSGGNAWGTMDPADLIAADYVPAGTPETTNRTFTSKGVFQDYYGRSPVGFSYSGAVGKAMA